ncbi:DUF397 domain-containing protein [Streptomyces sp. NBC_00328]|uniref:DUF397 domain-containing protein n=1 Tax=Streptomyces sp. NBC_00328 TaxID=2903646 RepID=UPI002E2C391D|nr:DUF397 domain-containing protein [Streptomyces sp. NBC_00328]
MTRQALAQGDSGLQWFKSTYSSSSNGNDCVEVALEWRKSTYSDSSNSSECVEIAPTPTAIHIRDSKKPGGARLAMAPAVWTAFIGFVAQG